MGLPTSLKWLYDDANIPHTKYQKEVEQKCLPLEIKWLDRFITEEFPRFCYYQKGGPDKGRDTCEVVVSTELLRDNFVGEKTLANQISPGAFGMKLTDLVKKRELPFYNKDDNNKPVRTKNENKSAWRFRRKDVYDWLVKNNFTDYKMEGDELPPPVGLLCSPH